MKQNRKKDLRVIRKQLLLANEEILQFIKSKLEPINDDLQQLYENLEEQYDNLSEQAQEGRSGDVIQSDMDDVEYIKESIEEYLEQEIDSTLAEDDEDRWSGTMFEDALSSINELLNKTADDY